MTETERDYDVIICGAGAGGLTAATLLGAAGRRVLLLDKRTDTVDTFKGELLQPSSLVTLDAMGALDSLRKAGGREIDRLVSSLSDGRELCSMNYRWLPNRYNHCLTHTYKGILDNFVAQLPTAVDFRRGVSVERALLNSTGRVNGVEVREGKRQERITAPLVVAADGYSSKLRNQLGIAVDAIQYDHQVVAIDLVDVPGLAGQATTVITPSGMRVMYPMPNNGGRLYLQIPKGLVNKIGKNGLAEWVDAAIAECPVLLPIADSIRNGMATCKVLSARRFVSPAFHGSGMPLIGDAAHSVHPMAGQGMNAAIADAAALAALCANVQLTNSEQMDAVLADYGRKRFAEVTTLSEFSHRFAALFTETLTVGGFAKTKYVLRCHGRNLRLCYKIMHNISGLGYQRFTVLDRLQQVGMPDRHARRIPGVAVVASARSGADKVLR